MSYNIAVTGAGGVIGYGVIKSIRRSEKFRSSRLIGIDCSPDSVGFFHCDRHYVTERTSSPGYVDQMLDLCRREQIDLLMPLIEEEFLPVHDNLQRFNEAGTRVVIQPRGIVEIFLDKHSTAISLKEAGIHTPDTLLLTPDNREGIEELKAIHGLPLIAKPRRGRGSRGLQIIRSDEELARYMKLLKDGNYVIQEYLKEEEEFTCSAFKTPGMNEPYVIAMRRELSNGTTVNAEVTFDETLLTTCRDIAKKFPFEGSFNVQLRKKNGIPYVFEVNPRYSSTVFIRTLCGFNDVEMGIEHFLEKRIDGQPVIEKLKVLRYWEELCIRSP